MDKITDVAKQYCQQFADCNLSKYDLEQAFLNGAKWMVYQHLDKEKLERMKEKRKNDKFIVEVSY